MAEIKLRIDEDQIQELLGSDRGLAVLLERVLNQVLEGEISEHLQAAPHERTPERRGQRNGYYERQLTTRVGRLTLRVPRDRSGRFSTELFERFQRSEKALVLSLMEMVVNGVSTRKVKRITEKLCGHEFKRSTVSELAKGLDVQVEAWNERPLKDDYPFVLFDAMYTKVRRDGAVRSMSLLIAVGINAEGFREVLGIRVANSETEAGWLEMFRWLKRRGLTGVEVAASDAHEGLVSALQQTFHGSMWQRCQFHFKRNILDRTPRQWTAAMDKGLDRIFKADDPEHARAAFFELADELEGKADEALLILEEGLADATAVLALPDKYRKRLRTTNMLERTIEEVRRRERVIRIFPNERSAWRLLGAFLAEVHEEWSTGKRYLNMDEYKNWKEALEKREIAQRAA